MKAAVVTFPGSNCDRDLAVALEQAGADVTRVWHKDDSLPEGMKDVAVYPNLIAEFLRLEYSFEDIAAIMGGNLMRVWQAAEAHAQEAAAATTASAP